MSRPEDELAFKYGVKTEQERIVKFIQTLLDEAYSASIQKPEYYDDVYTYTSLIDAITGEAHDWKQYSSGLDFSNL